MVGDECDIFMYSQIASKEQHTIYIYNNIIPTTCTDISHDFLVNKQNFLVLPGE